MNSTLAADYFRETYRAGDRGLELGAYTVYKLTVADRAYINAPWWAVGYLLKGNGDGSWLNRADFLAWSN